MLLLLLVFLSTSLQFVTFTTLSYTKVEVFAVVLMMVPLYTCTYTSEELTASDFMVTLRYPET
jgi:hypothetical protein